LIEYFVKGVPDAKTNKIMLYQAKTIKVLKEQIEVYKKVRGSYKMPYKNEARVPEADGSKSFDSKREIVR